MEKQKRKRQEKIETFFKRNTDTFNKGQDQGKRDDSGDKGNKKAEKKTFKFQLNSETYSVACDASMTVLDALNTSQIFKKEKEKRTNKDKAVLIQISREIPRAAVKADFPCCLIDDDEIIEVTFIKNDEGTSMQRNITEKGQNPSCSKPDMLVNFYIKKIGGEKVNVLLKSKALRVKVEYVCVYAHKEETLKEALEHDGRFKKVIFKKDCALSEIEGQCRHEMSHPVEHLDQKVFKVVVISDAIKPDSQDDLTSHVKTEPDEESDAQVADDVGSQDPVNTEHKTKQDKNEGESTGSSANRPAPKVIPDSEEILKILRDQFIGLLEKLKEREKLEIYQVQNFFKGEFAKSVENFLEVKNVKILADRSNSVCQIRVEGKPEGTGFLLFNRFILTNAHVVMPFASIIHEHPYLLIRLQKTVTAVFNFEDQDSGGTELSVKGDICAAALASDSMGRHLDYALLELNDDQTVNVPPLIAFHSYAPPRAGSQICIVGHPGVGVKKLDPCFIINLENRCTDNPFHIITPQNFEENMLTYDSCMYEGSSGSPIFDEHCFLIGMHTGWFTHENRQIEYAYSLNPILENIKIHEENKKKATA